MENLIDVLNRECETYEGLLELSRKKTPVIITGNLEELSRITDEEQEYASRLQNLDKTRAEVTADIANVLNRDVEALKLTKLIEILAARPSEQSALIDVRDRLQKVVHALRQVNEQNSELLKDSIEMVQIEMNLLQSFKAAPETANYSRGAYATGDTMGVTRGNFDAKQ
ncbi:MAG: flagellar protein FlgN [Lachnospiraceae bacterium]|jgi:flagellar biosynthesis/type III secretory pathway chaperone|nr:flagellar protein FlgN [Lachnospiraceae bacterium]